MKKTPHMGVFFICPPTADQLFRSASAKYASTWLGSSPAARSARNAAGGRTPGSGDSEAARQPGLIIALVVIMRVPRIAMKPVLNAHGGSRKAFALRLPTNASGPI